MNETAAGVEAAACGDRGAFHRLVVAHASRVRAVAFAILCDLPASEEIAQETFLAAWRGLRALKRPDQFGAWVASLARNLAVDALRKRARRRAEPLTEVADPAPDAESQMEEHERDTAIETALESLDEADRELLVLYYREGQSLDDAALVLGIREETARKRLSRARGRLREGVERRLGEAIARTPAPAVFGGLVLDRVPAGAPPAARVGPRLAASIGGVAAIGALVAIFGGAIGPNSWSAGALPTPTPERELVAIATPARSPVSESSSRPEPRTVPGRTPGTEGSAALIAPVTVERASLEGIVLSGSDPAPGVVVAVGCMTGDVNVEEAASVGKSVSKSSYTGDKFETAKTTSGIDGRFAVDAPAGSTCHVSASDPILGAAESPYSVPGTPVTLTLKIKATIRGQLVESDGTLVELQGMVTILREDFSTGMKIIQGAFAIRDLEPGRYRLRSFVFGRPAPDDISVEVAEGAVTHVSLVVPEHGTRVVGRIVDRQGRPLAGARVRVSLKTVMTSGIESASDGRFDLGEIRGGVIVVVKHGDRASARLELDGLGDEKEPLRDVGDIVVEAANKP